MTNWRSSTTLSLPLVNDAERTLVNDDELALVNDALADARQRRPDKGWSTALSLTLVNDDERPLVRGQQESSS